MSNEQVVSLCNPIASLEGEVRAVRQEVARVATALWRLAGCVEPEPENPIFRAHLRTMEQRP